MCLFQKSVGPTFSFVNNLDATRYSAVVLAERGEMTGEAISSPSAAVAHGVGLEHVAIELPEQSVSKPFEASRW